MEVDAPPPDLHYVPQQCSRRIRMAFSSTAFPIGWSDRSWKPHGMNILSARI
jgi:hypothetical protein